MNINVVYANPSRANWAGTDRISKGETVVIPISIMKTSPEIWGEDAREFK